MRSERKRQQTHATRHTATRLAAYATRLATFAALVALAAGATLFTAGPASAASSATTVNAVETDFHIKLSKTAFAAGKYVFVVQNKGQTTHSLKITGPGLSNAASRNIQPGQSTKLTVTFKKGAYDIFCSVPGHKALGMNMNISVRAAAANASAKTGGGGTGGAAF